LAYFYLKPFWTRKRLYFITAGVLFFTPTVVMYPSIVSHFTVWPLILSCSFYLLNIKAGVPDFVGVVVPTGAVAALIFWAIAVWRKI
jgi:hypothetical protein